jgi:hypothetical protein
LPLANKKGSEGRSEPSLLLGEVTRKKIKLPVSGSESAAVARAVAADLDRVQPDRSAAIPGPALLVVPANLDPAFQAAAAATAEPLLAAGYGSAARSPAATRLEALPNPEDAAAAGRSGAMVVQEVSVTLDQVRLGFLVTLDRVCRGFLVTLDQVRLEYQGRSGEWASRDSGERSGGLVYLEHRQEGRNNTRLKCGLMPYGFLFWGFKERASRHYESMLFLKIL